ncbi:RagB/SusD family nutrient uptake outer membrane protein [uncultured Duncaniella sp.]|uniref:RagB/SusD family nutrient uptake outer membrane protein n=1 Tax=uncultured Duncaniella sp. TaxID=2768039 RepID=UPI0025DD06CC|nr:RagB/SusD family nutrient uptake outer membrane protein [uncultured Duncaniella sp.]
MKLKSYIITAAACLAFSSCSDDFMKDMKNYQSTTPEAYNYRSGANGRLQDLYMLALPYTYNGALPYLSPSSGEADDMSKSTEEYSGFGAFVNPQIELTSMSNTNSVLDFFQGQANKIRNSAWGRIRDINDFINGVTGSTLSEEDKAEFLGQAYFLRAWSYYLMFKWYGGVPLVTDVLDPVPQIGVPRSTTKQTYDFIMKDLDMAATLLDGKVAGRNNYEYGRPTVATVLALKGRMMVLYASPLFNRTNDKQRWIDAYNFFLTAIPEINRYGNYLAYEGNPGTNASNWAKMFIDGASEANPEALWFAQYNTIASGGTPDYSKNNLWENGLRPSNSFGGGGRTPSATMVDLFPMKDGKRPSSYNSYTTLNPSDIAYDSNLPFLNRDPRFYRTFAFPGVCWAFEGDAVNAERHYPYEGNNYQLWNYVWYTKAEDRDDIENGDTYGPDGLLGNVKGMYIRKRTDDLHVSGAYRYVFSQGNGFKFSAAPVIEMRYTEVILNYAEAACQAGHPDVAVEQLKKVRTRVGYTGDCGLQSNLLSDEAACMAAILYERQIEFAYEGKRFDDLRRWMLFDGGQGIVSGAPSTWRLSGWGGNTCAYLGFEPLNGTRRENMEFCVQDKYNGGLGGDKFGSDGSNPDPLKDVERCAAVDYRNDLEPQLTTLADWYNSYLVRKEKKGDSYDSDHQQLYLNFRPNYYFPGLSYGAMTANPTIEQTIGWDNVANGGAAGTFDPLAE